MARRSGLVLTVLAGLVLLAPGAQALPADSPAARAVERAPLPTAIDYVALGDSYSAGPLIPSQRPDPAGCLRSFNNYPAYLAGYLGVATYRDVTCSGARVIDFSKPQKTIIPGPSPLPQLAALSAETDLVTVGIGGNDFTLFGSMIEACQQVAAQDPNGRPCKKYFTDSHGVDTKARDAKKISKHVRKGLKKIHRAAPNAQVFVVGYPRLLPGKGTCAAVPFAKGDYRWGGHIERLLNRSIKKAASATGTTYVDLYPVTKGHDACAGDNAWINGSELDLNRAADFHPFKVGEHQMGRAVYARITGLVAPDDGDADAAPPVGATVFNQL